MKRRVVVFLLGVCSCVLLSITALHAKEIDLTTVGSFGTVNGAIFRQYDPDHAMGTGAIDSFLRIQNNGVEHGYNTDGRPLEFDESKAWTRSLLLSDIPVLDIGGTNYREFVLDINQNGGNIFSLDELRIALGSTGNSLGYFSIFADSIYDLDDIEEDSYIKMDYSLNAGSGSGDMTVCIPDSLFTGGDYVYLYSKLGDTYAADDGFEEWAVGANGPVIPEPATIMLLGLGSLVLIRKRKNSI